jgi:hypothetical protein
MQSRPTCTDDDKHLREPPNAVTNDDEAHQASHGRPGRGPGPRALGERAMLGGLQKTG